MAFPSFSIEGELWEDEFFNPYVRWVAYRPQAAANEVTFDDPDDPDPETMGRVTPTQSGLWMVTVVLFDPDGPL